MTFSRFMKNNLGPNSITKTQIYYLEKNFNYKTTKAIVSNTSKMDRG